MPSGSSSTQGTLSAVRSLFTVCVLGILSTCLLSSCRVEPEEYPAFPMQIPEARFRIAYYEGGSYYDYTNNFRAFVVNLAELGWMEPLEIPEFTDPEDMQEIWLYVSENTQSDYIEFVQDAFWSAGWDDATRENFRRDAVRRLGDSHDIDLVIAMGTWAGQDLVTGSHSIPTMNLTSSNPVHAGIIDDPYSSPFSHVLVEVDPDRYKRNIKLFHEVIGFEKLGVVYEDSPDGRVYANLAELENASSELGFEIVRCTAEDVNLSESDAYAEVQACYQALAPQIDALWLGAHRGESAEFMPESLEIMIDNKIPVWSNQGGTTIQRGVLMGIWQQDFDYAGAWYAETAGRILNGATPGNLNNELIFPQRVLLNLETARRMEYEFPPGILEIADQTYDTIGD